MRRVATILLAAAAALTAPAGGAGSWQGEIDGLTTLKEYQPVLLFALGEHWLPTDPAVFERAAELDQRGRKWPFPPGWKRIKPQRPLPADARGRCQGPCGLNLPCKLLRQGAACYDALADSVARAALPTVYGELIPVSRRLDLPDGLKDRQPAYLARYWFFYYFDDWRWTWRDRGFTQAHEGDWEGITIGLDSRRRPLWAAFNQHCSGTWREWKPTSSDHLVVYVGLGSHASYFTPKPRPTYPLRCLAKYSPRSRVGRVVRRLKGFVERDARVVDVTGTAQQIGPEEVARGTARLIDLATVRADWKTFDGVWGEDQYLYFGSHPGPLNDGMGTSPKTPKFGSADLKDFWHDPGT